MSECTGDANDDDLLLLAKIVDVEALKVVLLVEEFTRAFGNGITDCDRSHRFLLR